MPTLIHRRVEAARRGELPQVIIRMPSGWVVLGDVQVTKGYCLLLPDPVVPHLNAMALPERTQFLGDMTKVGDALLKLTGAVRMNYEMLGNLEPALHAHVFPRYDDEPEGLRTKPIWSYDWQAARKFDPTQDRPFMDAVAAALRL